MSERDYIRELFTLFAEGKTSDFTKGVNEATRNIEADIADLQEQLKTIRKAMERLNVQRALPFPVEKSSGSAPGLDDVQRRVIKETVTELSKNGEFTVNEVIQSINRKGVKLTVSKPNAVIASTLSKWKEFRKVDKGKYILSSAS